MNSFMNKHDDEYATLTQIRGVYILLLTLNNFQHTKAITSPRYATIKAM